jgi:hypothetical protein
MSAKRCRERGRRLSLAGSVPRYFHLYDDVMSIDEEGKELASLQSARERAIDDAREMACAEVLHGHLNLRHRIEIADENGRVLATVQFQDVINVEPENQR